MCSKISRRNYDDITSQVALLTDFESIQLIKIFNILARCSFRNGGQTKI